MILPAVRDPRLVSVRRGGLLTEADHRLLALWAANCAEHVLELFEISNRADDRPRMPSGLLLLRHLTIRDGVPRVLSATGSVSDTGPSPLPGPGGPGP
ncbi:putative immunity protein [Arthrobacter zhangbolii]|uniref:putative immunity protein n=1 Tax=Arthrobacter zhangbolii TaxID=2886936 RepID=UPI00311AB646